MPLQAANFVTRKDQKREIPILSRQRPSTPNSNHDGTSNSQHDEGKIFSLDGCNSPRPVKPRPRDGVVDRTSGLRANQKVVHSGIDNGNTLAQKAMHAVQKTENRPAFDDTLSLNFDDLSSIDGVPDEYQPLDNGSQAGHLYQPPYTANSKLLTEEAFHRVFGAELQEARRAQYENVIRSSAYEQPVDPDSAESDINGSEYSGERQNIAPSTYQGNQTVASQHELENGSEGVYKDAANNPNAKIIKNRFKVNEEVQPQTENVAMRQLASNTKYPSKVSSYQESSSDEEQPSVTNQQISTQKRSYEQLDYDDETLKGMSITELDQIPFLMDPRRPQPTAALDTNGNPMSLSQKLNNLNKMSPEDQRNMFQSLDDSENEQAVTWFLQELSNEMKKLMEIRLERRKLSLQYEMQMKQQQRLVELESQHIETELQGLKQGGNQLIDGRKSSNIGLMTPRK